MREIGTKSGVKFCGGFFPCLLENELGVHKCYYCLLRHNKLLRGKVSVEAVSSSGVCGGLDED